MRSRTKLFALLLGVAIAVPALAQTGSVTVYPACPDPPPKLSQVELDAAHASYKVGVEAYETGDYQKALDNFRDSFRRDCTKVALLNFIARSYEGKGDRAEAIRALETYLQRNPKADDADKIQVRIQNLKAQLGSTATTATTATTTTTTTAPTATVTATATTAPTDTAPTADVQGHTAAPWVVAFSGLAVAIAGGVIIGIEQGRFTSATDGCTRDVMTGDITACPGAPLSEHKAQETDAIIWRGVGIGVGVAGFAALVTGLIWHFAESTGPKKTAFVPLIMPGYGGLSFSAKF